MSQAKFQIVPLSKIHPDPEQPRKNFPPEDMASLIASIKKHGIQSPLHVEEVGDGFLLEDGERRYRAAKELKLKEVPIIVQKAKSATERMIIQFHLQEQHKGWTATEKATAVHRLSETMGTSVREMGRLLAIPDRTINQYMAFAELLERKQFEKSEVSISYARELVNVRKYVTGQFEKNGAEFTRNQQKDLEISIIGRIKSGDITKPTDIVKIRDSARMNHASILTFMKNDKMSVQKLFIEADAKAAYHYRNAKSFARNISVNIRAGLPLKIGRFLTKNDIAEFKKASEMIDELLKV